MENLSQNQQEVNKFYQQNQQSNLSENKIDRLTDPTTHFSLYKVREKYYIKYAGYVERLIDRNEYEYFLKIKEREMLTVCDKKK